MNILIICPTYARNNNTPSGKNMYELITYFAEHYDADFTVLTSIDEQNLRNKHINVHYIELETAYWNRERKDLSQRLIDYNIINQFYFRIRLRIINHILDRGKAKNEMHYKKFKEWVKRQKKEEYDALICMYAPYGILKHTFYALNHLNVNSFIPYILDPWADHYSTTTKTLQKRINQEERIFKASKKIFCYEELVTKRHYSPIYKYLNKTEYVPTHLLSQNNRIVKNVFSDGKIHCIYAGMFYRNIREPDHLLECFLYLPHNYVLDIYIRGGFDDILKRYKERLKDRLIIHPYLTDPDEFNQVMNSADILVNIGNKVNNEIPSKLYEYCTYCKPIIHFINSENDPALTRFTDYPAIKFIDYDEDLQVMARKMDEFYLNVKNCTINYQTVSKLFDKYTIENVADKIINCIK